MFIEELLGIATYLYEAGNLDKLIEADLQRWLLITQGSEKSLLAHTDICEGLAIHGYRRCKPGEHARLGTGQAIADQDVGKSSRLSAQVFPILGWHLDGDIDYMVKDEIGIAGMIVGSRGMTGLGPKRRDQGTRHALCRAPSSSYQGCFMPG